MLAISILCALVVGAIYYARSGPQTSVFGMSVGRIPDVFGVGQRSLRRSSSRADRKASA